MYFFQLIIIFIVISILDYFIVKLEIKQNIDLFYDLHKNKVNKILNKSDKLNENEVKNK